MLIGPDTQTWQGSLLLLCDDGTIWTDAGPHTEPRWIQFQLPPGCVGIVAPATPSEVMSKLRRLEEEAHQKALVANDSSNRNWFMGEEIAYNVAAQIVAEELGVE
jgi:hypothetical protein